MTCTRCSQAIAWHCAGVCGSIFPPRWRAPRLSRPCRTSWRHHPGLQLEMSSSDRQVDLVQEGFDCVLRLGPITGRDADCPAAWGLLRMVKRRQSRLSGAPWRPSIAGRSPASGPSDNSIFDDCWAQDPIGWEYPHGGSYTTLQLPGALHVTSAQTYEAAALAGLGLIQAPLLGNWPILGE